MSDRKEIVLPYDLYHRIRISSEEHGGIGAGALFTDFLKSPTSANLASGMPLCVHGHAWGTCTRFAREKHLAWNPLGEHPELRPLISVDENDTAIYRAGYQAGERVPFARWCELLNVKCGPKQGEGVDKPRQAIGTLGRVATPEPAGAA